MGAMQRGLAEALWARLKGRPAEDDGRLRAQNLLAAAYFLSSIIQSSAPYLLSSIIIFKVQHLFGCAIQPPHTSVSGWVDNGGVRCRNYARTETSLACIHGANKVIIIINNVKRPRGAIVLSADRLHGRVRRS